MMRILDRYLLRELLRPLGICLAGFLVFWICFDLFSELDTFQEAGLGWWDLVRYYGLRTPRLLVEILPMVLLLAMLYALTQHARHEEITAMKASGLSLWRISAPYFAVGLAASVAVLVLNEFWVPGAMERSQAMLEGGKEAAERTIFRSVDLANDEAGRTWHLQAYDPALREMTRPDVKWTDETGAGWHLVAAVGRWTGDGWRFEDGTLFFYPKGVSYGQPRPFEVRDMPEFTETPDQVLSEIKINRLHRLQAAKRLHLSVREILAYQRLHPDLSPERRALVATQFHGQLASPWTCLVVVLIALPFGGAGGRRNVFVGVAGSLAVFFVFFLLFRLGLALGIGGKLPPIVAGWLPNLVFGAVGLGLIGRGG